MDAAYRRIPVCDDDLWAMGIMFKHDERIWIAEHSATPFGSIGSVHAWYRIGAAPASIIIKILHIPALRYVDDFFSAEWPGSAIHALICVQRCRFFNDIFAKNRLLC